MKELLRKMVPAAAVLLSFALVTGAFPQAMKSDHWSRAELLERANDLRQRASEKGSASEKLETYPHHFTMLAFRNRSGGGEVHRDFADVFYIMDGRATLVTGGEVVDPKIDWAWRNARRFGQRRIAAGTENRRCGAHSRRHASPDGPGRGRDGYVLRSKSRTDAITQARRRRQDPRQNARIIEA